MKRTVDSKTILAYFFRFDEGTRLLTHNGDKEEKDEVWELEDLGKGEAKEFRSHSARMNYMGQDGPDFQFPAKGCSKEMAIPKIGSWRMIKTVGRYLVGRKAVVWMYAW